MVEAAILAPSAENTQPWRFSIDGDRLLVAMDARRGLSSDVDSMLTLTGIGAAIENAVISARGQGWEPTVAYGRQHEFKGNVPGREQDDYDCVAEISTDPADAFDPLFSFLADRCTSRRLNSTPVAPQTLQRLVDSLEAFPDVHVDWLTSTAEIRPLAKLVGLGNRIRFEHEPFHREFYDNVRFSQAEVVSTRDGLDVRTLQLPVGVASVLRSLRTWSCMRAANYVGFSRLVARQAADEVCSSGAVGILSVAASTRESFVEGGRALERIWLTAVAAGLGFHPTASLPVFLAYAQRTDGSALLTKHRPLVAGMSARFRRLFPHIEDRTVQMIFRVGRAEWPPVCSLRRTIDDVADIHDGVN